MIFLLSRDEIIRAVLKNESPEAIPYFDDEIAYKKENGFLGFNFSFPGNTEAAGFAVKGNLVVTKDMDGRLLLFEIINTDENKKDGKLVITVFSENAATGDLGGDFVRPCTLNGYTMEQAGNYVLQGQRWQLRIAEYTGVASFEWKDYPSVLKALHDIRNAFDCDIVFQVEFLGNRIAGRYVDLVQSRGVDTGIVLDHATDIVGIRRYTVDEEVKTALVGLGKADADGNRLTFADVVWSVANGDPVDKPAGLDWVGEPGAFQRWNMDGKHLFGVYENQDITSGLDLLRKTWDDLQNRNYPKYAYEVEAICTENISGYEHRKVRIGDKQYIKDMDFNPYLLLQAEAIEVYRHKDPSKDKVVYGNYVPFTFDQNEIINRLKTQISGVPKDFSEMSGTVSGGQIANGAIRDTHLDRTSQYRVQIQTADIKDAAITSAKIGMAQIQDAHIDRASVNKLVVVTADIKDASITTAKIANLAVDTANINTAAITSAKIGNAEIKSANIGTAQIQNAHLDRATANKIQIGTADIVDANITNAKIANGSIDSAKIIDGSITHAKIGLEAVDVSNIKSATITSALIADAAITSAKIQDASILQAKIANLSVGTAQIIDAAISTAKIGNAQITGAKIAAATITYANIANATIGTAQIADAAITSAKIDDAQITTAKIADAQITNAKIDRASVDKLQVTTADIVDASIVNAKIANASIDSAKIKDGSITTAKIGIGAIDTALIQDSAIGTAQIADGSITDAKIIGLTANKITAGTIDAADIEVINLKAANITVGTINGYQITDSAITNDKLADGAITGDKIQTGAITSDKIPVGTITESQINWKTHLLF